MRRLCIAAAMLLALAAVPAFRAEDKKDKEDGFVPMFNGKDLTGWVNVNCAPGTFFVKDGEIITTGKPTGFLRTEKQYENFIADFEWMHVNKTAVGNSGFFVWADPLPAVGTGYTRGIEVQVLVNFDKDWATSHGDFFSIHGAHCKPDRPHPKGLERCLPSERRCKGGGEWNHYKVIANDGAIKLHVNGKEVSGVSECKPRKGYLALESEEAECHFRNLKIKELPATNLLKPDEVAEMDQGFKNLFNGLDLAGWKADKAAQHWQPRDGVLRYDGKPQDEIALATDKDFGDSEYILDYRFTAKKGEKQAPCAFIFHGDQDKGVTLWLTPELGYTVKALGSTTTGESKAPPKPSGQWNRLRVSLKGSQFQVTVNGKDWVKVPIAGTATKGPFVLKPGGEMEFRTLFARELKD